MKKFFIFAALLIIVCNIYYHLTYKGDIRTPYYEFKTRIGTVPLKTYRDTNFGYTISYPCMFQQEDKQGDEYLGHARFVYSDDENIIWNVTSPRISVSIFNLAPIRSPISYTLLLRC